MPPPAAQPNPRQKADQALEKLRASPPCTQSQLHARLTALRSRATATTLKRAGVVLAVALAVAQLGWAIPVFALPLLAAPVLLVLMVGFASWVWPHWEARSQATAALRDLLTENPGKWKFYPSLGAKGSFKPADDLPSWSWLSGAVAPYPELAGIWAQWLVSDAPLREDDLNRIHGVLELFRDAERWEKTRQALPGQDPQAQFRTEALKGLPEPVVAQARVSVAHQRAQDLEQVFQQAPATAPPRLRL